MSLGNILTVLDQWKNVDDQILVFDRALVTAYSWAFLRNRLPEPRIKEEFRLVLESDAYKNCHTILVDPNPIFVADNDREKDFWDNSHTFEEEMNIIEDLCLENGHLLNNREVGNRFHRFKNEFDDLSVERFVNWMNSFTTVINT
jgi:hypothetical protein